MANIILLESEENSPIAAYLEEMGHSVIKGEHTGESAFSYDSIDLLIREEDVSLSADAQSTASAHSSYEEKNGAKGKEKISRLKSELESDRRELNTPEILIFKTYEPDTIESKLGASQFGFLVRPVTKASVATVVGNALGRSGIHLSSVLNSLNMPFYVLDVHSYEIVLANKEALKLYRNNETTCYELTHHSKTPCIGTDHACPLQKVIDTKRPFTTEHIHYDGKGETRYVEVWGYPVMNEAGEVTHMIEYSTDITERKREEREVRKLTTAVDRSAHIILISGVEGRVEFVNRAFELKIGCSRQEVIGRKVEELEKESKIGRYYSIIKTAIQSAKSHYGEFSYTQHNGTFTWENVSVTPIRNDKGEIVNFIAVAEDISSQVKQKETLQEAKEEAERANTLKSQFLANISHELRTPLNIVLGFTDLLIEEEDSEEKIKKLRNIRYAGGNLLTIINDLLDFTQLENAQLELKENAFSLHDLLERIQELYSRTAAEKGLELKERCEGEVPELVRGDENRLEQVITNLVSNAVKFTSEGSVEILCYYDNKKAQIQVSDTGIGIDEARCTDIFSPFEQIDGSTSRKYGGTGLGLAISNNLIEKMGGEIQVQSTHGQGSCFTVQIPLPPFEEKGEVMSSENTLEETQTSTKPKHILIAEDNRVNQRLMKLMVEKMGHSSSIASNGVETLEQLGHTGFDVLLLDMHMPIKDGLDVIHEIRAQKTLRHLYVIALTASATKEDAENFISAGCDDYMAKPVDQKELEAKLNASRGIK